MQGKQELNLFEGVVWTKAKVLVVVDVCCSDCCASKHNLVQRLLFCIRLRYGVQWDLDCMM